MIEPSKFVPLLAASTAAMFPFPGNQAAATAGSTKPFEARGQAIRLRTDSLPTALVVPGDPRGRRVTSFEIQGELPPAGDGKGSITFDESRLTFNEFGDATKVASKKAVPIPVIFRWVWPEKQPGKAGSSGSPTPALRVQKSEKRRVYELVFADGSLPHRLHLVLSGDTGGPHRLLILGHEDRPEPAIHYQMAAILDLHGLPAVRDPLPDAPFRSRIQLRTLYSVPPGWLRWLTVSGMPGGPATLHRDPNHLTFNAFGDVIMTTLMASPPIKATLKRVEIARPAMKGRRLFEVVPTGVKLEERYFVVLSPTERGPHQLLIRQGGALRQLLPLRDRDRDYQAKLQPELEATPPEEQQAIAAMRRAIGYPFRFLVKSGSVVRLLVDGGGSAGKIDPMLKHLGNLRDLEFSSVPLGAAGLASLRHLGKLRDLGFMDARIDDAGLAHLRDLPQLQRLTFSRCSGMTDRGVAHLAGLKNLRFLELSREDTLSETKPRVECITDAGVEHLKGLTALEYLNLMGLTITDAGLERLKGLVQLRQLYLSGEGITDAGLSHLEGLRQLRKLELFRTKVTPAGIKALKAKLPMLERGDQDGY